MKIGIGAALMCGFVCHAQSQPPQQAPPLPAPEPSWHTIARGETFVPMTGRQRADFLLRRTLFSVGTPARAATLAAFDQWTNDPEAWGQGWDAYGRRFANRWATTGVRNAIESGAAAALGYEQRYIQCDCDGTLRRVRHAVAMSFVTYDRNGHWVPNVPRIGSTIAAEYLARRWRPDQTRTAGENASGLAVLVFTGSLVNVWREFSPPLVRQLKSKLPWK